MVYYNWVQMDNILWKVIEYHNFEFIEPPFGLQMYKKKLSFRFFSQERTLTQVEIGIAAWLG